MATRRFNFTKAGLDALSVPGKGKRVYYFDTRTRFLALCVTSAGAKTFYIYRWFEGKPQQHRIGPYPDLSIEQARKKAEEFNGLVAQGEDPKQPARKNLTFGDLFTWYLEHHAMPKKVTWAKDKAQFERHLKGLAPMKVVEIKPYHIQDLHHKLGQKKGRRGGHYEANRTMALLRGVFNQGIRHGKVKGPNPVQVVQRYREQSRDRRLMPAEMPYFFKAVDEDASVNVRDFLLLLLYTGARRGNVATMRWEDLDLAAGTWRIPRTKNGTWQIVPLLPAALQILEQRRQAPASPWVFPAAKSQTEHMVEPQSGWRRVLERANQAQIKDGLAPTFTGLRMHDLRRTLGSWMVDTGAPIPVIGKALNHLNPQTTQIYARLSVDPVRQAMAKAVGAIHETVEDGLGISVEQMSRDGRRLTGLTSRILNHLETNADASFVAKEIASAIEGPLRSVESTLNRLVRQGRIRRAQKGYACSGQPDRPPVVAG